MEEAQDTFAHSTVTHDIDSARRSIQHHQELKKSMYGLLTIIYNDNYPVTEGHPLKLMA